MAHDDDERHRPGGVGSIAISLLFGVSGVDPCQLGRVTLQGGAPLLHSKQLKALAVSTPERVKQLPDTPTSKQAGSDSFTLIGWNGIAGPADLPAGIVDQWDQALRTLATDLILRTWRVCKRRLPTMLVA